MQARPEYPEHTRRIFHEFPALSIQDHPATGQQQTDRLHVNVTDIFPLLPPHPEDTPTSHHHDATITSPQAHSGTF